MKYIQQWVIEGYGCGSVEVTVRDETGRNDTFEVIIEANYGVIDDDDLEMKVYDEVIEYL